MINYPFFSFLFYIFPTFDIIASAFHEKQVNSTQLNE